MNEPWKKFLSQTGAVIDDGVVEDFGDPPAERRAASSAGVVCDLSHRRLIAVGGEDAFAFLQGQLTCDMNQISPAQSRLAAWCSPKGRVLMLFRVVHRADGLLLELPALQIEAAIKRLEMYVFRARVSLKDVSDDFVRIGLAGDAAESLLQSRYGTAPRSPDEAAAAGDDCIIRLHGPRPRYEFIGSPSRAEEIWRAAAGTLTPAGHQVWSLLQILAGVPEFTPSDEHLPQMINLHVLEGLSFHKGCFVGQEIIARAHHLGRLKRRMYLINAPAHATPARGTPIIDAAAGSEAGQIIDSAPCSEAGSFAALAVLRIDAAKGGSLRLGAADGPQVELMELPYPTADSAR